MSRRMTGAEPANHPPPAGRDQWAGRLIPIPYRVPPIGGSRGRPGCPMTGAKPMEPAAKRRLGDIFVERGLIHGAQLEEALSVQRESGGKLGEVLVELGFVTRVELAGVIVEQWDELRMTARGRKTAETEARSAPAPSSIVETALRERLDALTAELADRDRRIAQQDATISALLAKPNPAAA